MKNDFYSSYLLGENLTSKGITCMKLSDIQKKLINGSKHPNGGIIGLDIKRDIFITEFISNSDLTKLDIIKKYEHIIYTSIKLSPDNYHFVEFKINGKSIYLYLKHTEAEQMNFSEFVREFRYLFYNKYGDMKVKVKYDDNGVYLTFLDEVKI